MKAWQLMAVELLRNPYPVALKQMRKLLHDLQGTSGNKPYKGIRELAISSLLHCQRLLRGNFLIINAFTWVPQLFPSMVYEYSYFSLGEIIILQMKELWKIYPHYFHESQLSDIRSFLSRGNKMVRKWKMKNCLVKQSKIWKSFSLL